MCRLLCSRLYASPISRGQCLISHRHHHHLNCSSSSLPKTPFHNSPESLPLSNPPSITFLLPIHILLLLPPSQRPNAHTNLAPSLTPNIPKLRVRPLLTFDAAIIIHKPRLVALPRRIRRHVHLPIQPQVVVALLARRVPAVQSTKIHQYQSPRRNVSLGEEPVLPACWMQRVLDGLDLDVRTGRGGGW